MPQGATRGRRQRGNVAQYDPAKGVAYKSSFSLPPTVGQQLIEVAERLDVSVSGLISQLIQHMELNDDGLPAWAADSRRQQSA